MCVSGGQVAIRCGSGSRAKAGGFWRGFYWFLASIPEIDGSECGKTHLRLVEPGSLMDYAMSRALGAPNVEILTHGLPSVMNPLGAKGVGESGCIDIPAAIANAAVDALRPFGVNPLDMLLTPERLWKAMQTDPGFGAEGK